MSVLQLEGTDDISLEAAVCASELRQKTATAVTHSVQVSEQADPGVRFRVAQEALLRLRRAPR